jgi:prepilin-type N-terminal cleavage/methylation domain-containing protein
MSIRTAGHTLLEMLVVVAVLASLTALVAPRLGMLSRTRLEAAAHDLSDRLQAARTAKACRESSIFMASLVVTAAPPIDCAIEFILHLLN